MTVVCSVFDSAAQSVDNWVELWEMLPVEQMVVAKVGMKVV